jgi:hypothetical protein
VDTVRETDIFSSASDDAVNLRMGGDSFADIADIIGREGAGAL